MGGQRHSPAPARRQVSGPTRTTCSDRPFDCRGPPGQPPFLQQLDGQTRARPTNWHRHRIARISRIDRQRQSQVRSRTTMARQVYPTLVGQVNFYPGKPIPTPRHAINLVPRRSGTSALRFNNSPTQLTNSQTPQFTNLIGLTAAWQARPARTRPQSSCTAARLLCRSRTGSSGSRCAVPAQESSSCCRRAPCDSR